MLKNKIKLGIIIGIPFVLMGSFFLGASYGKNKQENIQSAAIMQYQRALVEKQKELEKQRLVREQEYIEIRGTLRNETDSCLDSPIPDSIYQRLR